MTFSPCDKIFSNDRRSASPAYRLAVALALVANLSWGEEPAPAPLPAVSPATADEPAPVIEPAPEPSAEESAPEPARKALKLPGLVIDFQKRCVDIEASICLEEGMLELIACTKGSKEHESIVAITAKAMHIHTALLALGAKNGNPAMRKPIGEQQTRWIDLPPRGDPVDVYLVFENRDGELVEHPISDFVTRTGGRPDELFGADDGRADDAGADDVDADKENEFPHTFLFAGSHLFGDGPGPRKYLADHSGNVISIATFGDELLCLPFVVGHANDSLMWQVDANDLLNVGSKVTLRLRPKRPPTAKDGKADQLPSVRTSATEQ